MAQCKLLHHGAAASSSTHNLVWIPNDDIEEDNSTEDNSNSSSLVYTSHGIINISRRVTVTLSKGKSCPSIWTVEETLRNVSNITALCTLWNLTPQSLPNDNNNAGDSMHQPSPTAVAGLVAGSCDGSVNIWWRQRRRRTQKSGSNLIEQEDKDHKGWRFQALVDPQDDNAGKASCAITDLDGLALVTLSTTNDNKQQQKEDRSIIVVVCTCKGLDLLIGNEQTITNRTRLLSTAVNTAKLQYVASLNQILLLVGTASPRYNKIHIYSMSSEDFTTPKYGGFLMGHEDWLTDFSWDFPPSNTSASVAFLASSSQDAKIRLWEFRTVEEDDQGEQQVRAANEPTGEDTLAEDEYANIQEEDEDDETEARLEIRHNRKVTRVSLEALLYGHEEAVTSVSWHPNPQQIYKQDRILLSSSMDRCLLIWSCATSVWTPLTRVGAAGGILGGSIGSTLLGFVSAAPEPRTGKSLVGQAYGGAIHVWSMEQDPEVSDTADTEQLSVATRWNASSCITGHFEGITDCCWETYAHDYLLTVSSDQTCRLWGPIETKDASCGQRDVVWVELARPQVHGYDLATVASVSTAEHRDLMVTGADEKEIRSFVAPKMTLATLDAVNGTGTRTDLADRVERAYIPSLGLSNKASAADGAEADTEGAASNNDNGEINLPLERDLGAISLWPEVKKLYGHNTELYCIVSSLTAKSGNVSDGPFSSQVLVASAAKARDVKDASIRIWEVTSGKCIQVLGGSHKSTVATLAFSPDGKYLASAGKDRRLSIWQRNNESKEISFYLAVAIEGAHKRIIWSVHFCPHDATLLASGSREGVVKIWRLQTENDDTTTASNLYTFKPRAKSGAKADSVTALAFAPQEVNGCSLLAIGVESGLIELWKVPSDESGECELFHCLDPWLCHAATVTKLCWRKMCAGDKLTLASVSSDHGCRIFTISCQQD